MDLKNNPALNNSYKQTPTSRSTHIWVLQPSVNPFLKKNKVFNVFYVTEVILRAADYQPSEVI